jgi:hypothetical protein
MKKRKRIVPRRTWNINPKEQIVLDGTNYKRKKPKKIIITKDTAQDYEDMFNL